MDFESTITCNPTSLVFDIKGGTQNVTVTNISKYVNTGLRISISVETTFTSAIADTYSNAISRTASNSVISVKAADNYNSIPRNTTLTVTNNYGITATVPISQASGVGFAHQKGLSGRDLLANGMQGVHTERFVMFVPNNTDVSLKVSEPSFNYSRWYQYNTDSAVTTGTLTLSGYNNVMNYKGVYKTTSDVGTPTYRYNSTETSGIIAEIACDMSYYVDYTTLQNFLTKEPTLSQRAIFEIHPAAEMATKLTQHVNNDGATTGSYLEEYNIVAPLNRDVRFGPKYTYKGSLSNYFSSATTRLTSGTWYKNGVEITAPTISNNRVLSISAATTVGTDVYTLVSGGYGIAKFTITYKAESEVGPSATAIATESNLNANYKYVTGLRFDGDNNTPLEWNESGYGFYYQNSSIRHTTHPTAYWAEYMLMNITTSSYSWLSQDVRDMKYQNSGVTTGNFFYVDASSTPGVIANLQFKEGGLCPGSRMYVSTWVNNLGTGTNPNLNFTVVGIEADNSQTEVFTFTTGDLNITRGTWHQLFFEIDMPQVDYADYRLRISNNAQNASGNDFAIDDICIYMQKPTLMAYQSGVACSNNSDSVVVMVRMNPDNLSAIESNNGIQTVYYQFQQSNGTPLHFDNYLNQSEYQYKKYGWAEVNTAKTNYDHTTYMPDLDANGNVLVTGLDKYLNDLNAGIQVPQAFYTKEKNEKGVLENALYIFHNDPIFKAGTTYICSIASDYKIFGEDNQCGLSSTFTVQARAKLILNGVANDGLTATGMCSNQYNSIRLGVFGSQSGLEEFMNGTCKADWLEGYSGDFVAGGKYQDYDFSTLQQALAAFRDAYPSAEDMTGVVPTGNFTQSQIDLITEFISRGYLDLYKDEILRRSLLATIHYTAFPIVSTAFAEDGTLIQICNSPITISLTASEGKNSLYVMKNTETDIPTSVKEQRFVRLSAEQANANPLELPVYLNGMTEDQLRNSQVYLLATTTDKTAGPLDNNTTANVVFSTISVATQADGQVIMSLSGRHADLTFKPGHQYDFIIVVPLFTDEGCQSAGRFSIMVVPDMVMWSPKNDSHSWHVDHNWSMIDAQGNVLTDGNGYVPAAHTNVLINKNSTIPVLQDYVPASASSSVVTLKDAAKQNIAWDINFVPNTCHNIHLGVGGLFGGQMNLNYDSAWVDMKLSTSGWNLVAPPFEGMVVGDMYIPSTGENTPLFAEVASPDSRNAYEVFTSLYNTSSYQLDRNNQSTVIQNAEWTTPANALSTPIETANGYSVRIVDHVASADSVLVRLPKTDTRYYYFGSYGEQTNLYEDIVRPSYSHRLAGTNGKKENIADFADVYNKDKTSHLMANPYLSELDMNKFMLDDYNSAKVSDRYAIIDANRTERIVDMANGITNQGPMTDADLLIAPMTSFMVWINQANVSNPQLKVAPSMAIDYLNSERSSVRTKVIDDRALLVINASRNGVTSSCTIMKKQNGNDGFDENDSPLMMFSHNITPSGIYTNVDNNALSINILSDINMTALGYAVIDESTTESIELTFNGVDEFEGTLSLYDAFSKQFTQLTEGITISLPELVNSDSRYFICYKSNDVTDQIDDYTMNGQVKIFQSENGLISVTSDTSMKQIRVFNVSGQLITERYNLDSSLENFHLTAGIYLFEVECAQSTTTHKTIVR